MVDYAASEFELEKKQEDGNTLRDHLKSLYRQTGVLPEQLKEATELPELLDYLWGYFQQLSSERPVNGFSMQCITSTGIKDWCALHGVTLEIWEVRALKEIDRAFIESTSETKPNE